MDSYVFITYSKGSSWLFSRFFLWLFDFQVLDLAADVLKGFLPQTFECSLQILEGLVGGSWREFVVVCFHLTWRTGFKGSSRVPKVFDVLRCSLRCSSLILEGHLQVPDGIQRNSEESATLWEVFCYGAEWISRISTVLTLFPDIRDEDGNWTVAVELSQHVTDRVDLWLHLFVLNDLRYQASERVELLHTVSLQLCFSVTGCFSIP